MRAILLAKANATSFGGLSILRALRSTASDRHGADDSPELLVIRPSLTSVLFSLGVSHAAKARQIR